MPLTDLQTMTVDGVTYTWSNDRQAWEPPQVPSRSDVTYVQELETPALRAAPYPDEDS